MPVAHHGQMPSFKAYLQVMTRHGQTPGLQNLDQRVHYLLDRHPVRAIFHRSVADRNATSPVTPQSFLIFVAIIGTVWMPFRQVGDFPEDDSAYRFEACGWPG